MTTTTSDSATSCGHGGCKKPFETIVVDTPKICCDGTGHNNITPHLGHPAVYLTVSAHEAADCPYCGRQFVLKEGAATGGHH